MPQEMSITSPGSEFDDEKLGDDEAPDCKGTRRVGGSLFHN